MSRIAAGPAEYSVQTTTFAEIRQVCEILQATERNHDAHLEQFCLVLRTSWAWVGSTLIELRWNDRSEP